MTDVIGLVSSAYAKLKQLRQLQEAMKSIETKELIADLLSDLADIKIEAASLKEENLRLTEAVKTKSRADTLRDMLDFTGNVYVLRQDAEGFPAGTPFCPRCIDVDRLVMPLTEQEVQAFGRYKCNQCDKFY